MVHFKVEDLSPGKINQYRELFEQEL